MLRLAPFLIAMLVTANVVAAQSKSVPDKDATSQGAKQGKDVGYQPVPVEEARRPNPVKMTPESLASGKKVFAMECALCHGADGRGRTEYSKQSKIPDLTSAATLKGRSDGELFYRIKNGHGEMPGEGDRVKPEQIWDVVNYVRSLAEKNEKKVSEEK